MPDYRCFFLGQDGRITDAEEFRCDGDGLAIAKAATLMAKRVPHNGAELWSLSNRVAEFPKSPEDP